MLTWSIYWRPPRRVVIILSTWSAGHFRWWKMVIRLRPSKSCLAMSTTRPKDRSWNQSVGDLMKPNVVAFESTTPLKIVYNFLCRVSIRQVIIIENDNPVGALSRSGFVRWYLHWLEARGSISLGQEGSPSKKSYPLGLATITNQLSHQVDTLCRSITEPSDNLRPIVVGSATRLQELSHDLLAFASTSPSPFSLPVPSSSEPS